MTATDGVDWHRVADAIQTRMDEKLLSQARLAEIAGVSPVTLRNLVHGRETAYRHETLVKVSTALGWGVDGLVRIGQGANRKDVERAEAARAGDTDVTATLLELRDQYDEIIRRLADLERDRGDR